MKNFRELTVWVKGYELTLEIYRITAKFPKDEIYGLTAQIRRAGVSIPANIAEGCGREGDAEFSRFLVIAMGSSSELECLFLLARDLRYLNAADFELLSGGLTSLRKMLNALIQKLKSDRGLHPSIRRPPSAIGSHPRARR
jgi:four helix bundle protein